MLSPLQRSSVGRNIPLSRSLLSLLGLLLTVSPAFAAENSPGAAMPGRHRAFLEKNCQKCHDAKKQEGKFRVDDLRLELSDLETAERWQKVLNALNAGEMPPADERQPPDTDKADFLDNLANVMVAARKSLGDQRGAMTMRRLNRREYRNTLRALLGVEINVSELPSDSGSGSFDTVGSNLFMSSDQFEQYLALGREALDEAFDRQASAGVQKKLRFEGEESLPTITKFVNEEFDATERGQKWGAAVMAAAAQPQNQAIVAEIRKTAKDDAILRRSWSKIQGAPSPETFGFATGENNADKANRAAGLTGNHPYYRYYLGLPALDRGAYLTIGQQDRVNSWITLMAPFGWPVGDYTVRIRIAATDDAPAERRFLEFGINPRHGQVLRTHHITGTMAEPQVIEIPWTLTRKHSDRSDRVLFIREKGTNDHIETTRRLFNEAVKRNKVGPPAVLWVDWMELEYHPADAVPSSPGLAALQIPLDDKASPPIADVRAALERFALEAFRGSPPTKAYVDRLLGLYEVGRKSGGKHGATLRQTLAVVLASPRFLYLAEPSNEKPRPLTDLELATRLSYFLWGAPPDAALRELARRGELSKPEVLAAQTNRLLDDPRSAGFVSPLIDQWLGMDRLDFFEINHALYPRFDDSTKLAARHEVDQTFAYLLRHNASLRELLKSDAVVVNSLMASFYGIEGVAGDEFQRTPVPQGSPRGGLLGMAAVSVMGGNGERTSPVERGAWVLRKLLNDPPPPAPANVPAITRLAAQSLTPRERLRIHQEAAQCASCHRKIDPIGLGLENFDAVGQWRTLDTYQAMDASGKPVPGSTKKSWTIDPSAALHNGPAFKDFYELRDIIAGKSESFARSFSAALIEYAFGRPVGFHDEALMEVMLRQARQKDLGLREFVQTLVRSREFQTK